MDAQPTPSEWVECYGDLLFSFAYSRTGNIDVAEDAVQETLFRGIRALGNFQGKSSVKTWLMGILRNVIRESRRKSDRSIGVDDIEVEREDALESSVMTGEYLRRLQPSEAVERIEFWEVLEKCLEKLPSKTAQLFWEREVEGSDSKELRQKHGISSGNLWVRIHRAKQFLIGCISHALGIKRNDPPLE